MMWAAARKVGKQMDAARRSKITGEDLKDPWVSRDGTFNHFDLCVKINRWTPEVADVFLELSLLGQARRLLTGLKPANADGIGN